MGPRTQAPEYGQWISVCIAVMTSTLLIEWHQYGLFCWPASASVVSPAKSRNQGSLPVSYRGHDDIACHAAVKTNQGSTGPEQLTASADRLCPACWREHAKWLRLRMRRSILYAYGCALIMKRELSMNRIEITTLAEVEVAQHEIGQRGRDSLAG